MPKVQKQTAGKIGMLSAIIMLFGAVVGIGIFFKNTNVFKLNNYNWIGVIGSWGFSVLIIICMALSFAELSTCQMANKNAGFGGWAKVFFPHGFGRYSKLAYPLTFYSMNTFAVVFFAGEAVLNCFGNLGIHGSAIGGFDFGRFSALYVFIIGGVIYGLLCLVNYFVSKAMCRFSDIMGAIKFLPMLMVILLGVIFGIMNGGGLWAGKAFDPPWKDAPIVGSFSFVGMIQAVPCILFAYEGYLVVGNIAGEMDNPNKQVPIAVVVGVAIVSLLYLGITIGCVTAGTGNVYELMWIVGNEKVAKILTYVISILIFICLLGTLNSLVFTGARGYQAVCEDDTLFLGKKLANAKPDNPLFAGIIWMALAVGFWWVVTAIPSVIYNTDTIPDAVSTVMVVFLYIIYGATVLAGFVNRFTKKHTTNWFTIFPFAAVIAILGSLIIFSVSGVNQFIVEPVKTIMNGGLFKPYDCGWGLFLKPGGDLQYLSCLEVIVCFWGMFLITAIMPFINDLLIKCFDRQNTQRLIWQGK